MTFKISEMLTLSRYMLSHINKSERAIYHVMVIFVYILYRNKKKEIRGNVEEILFEEIQALRIVCSAILARHTVQ